MNEDEDQSMRLSEQIEYDDEDVNNDNIDENGESINYDDFDPLEDLSYET